MKSNLKIIALLPFKNEAHNLFAYMKNISKLADLVIGYDDNSSDNSLEIFKDLGGLPITFDLEDNFSRGGQYKIRNELLNKGRELGGTHFIILDADEVFNENFINVGRNFICQLEFGEVLQLLWVSCYPDMNYYASGNSPWAPKYHDFIFCDSKQSYYPKSGLHFGRIPELSGKRVKVDSNIGVVLHKQFIFKEDFELKQCLYRMHEFLEGKSSTFAINHTYSITRQGFNDISALPQIWQSKEGFFSSPISTWRRDELRSMLNMYGVRKFKNLDIWESDFTLSIWRETFKVKNPKVKMNRAIPISILIKLLRLIKCKFNSLIHFMSNKLEFILDKDK
jgi:hypothetical protein